MWIECEHTSEKNCSRRSERVSGLAISFSSEVSSDRTLHILWLCLLLRRGWTLSNPFQTVFMPHPLTSTVIMNTKSTFKLNFLLISCYVNTQMYSNILWNLRYFPLYVIFIYLYLSPTTATWSLQYNNCNRFLDHVKQFSRSSIWNQV